MEHFIRMLQGCGLPASDCDMVHGNGKVVNEILVQARPRSTLFTGSGKIAEKLALDLKGKVCTHFVSCQCTCTDDQNWLTRRLHRQR